MANTLPCPGCGAPLTFASKASISAVCPYCRNLAIKTNMDLENFGKISELHDEVSILQIFTTGHYEGRSFTLTGRMQKKYDVGYWSEWCASFSDGSNAWLAEAQGFFAFLVPVETKLNVPSFQDMQVGTVVHIGKKDYEVSDKKESKLLSSEGELPFVVKPGENFKSIDLKACDESDDFASIEYLADGTAVAFTGKLFDRDELRLGNLRELEGW